MQAGQAGVKAVEVIEAEIAKGNAYKSHILSAHSMQMMLMHMDWIRNAM